MLASTQCLYIIYDPAFERLDRRGKVNAFKDSVRQQADSLQNNLTVKYHSLQKSLARNIVCE